MVIFDMKQILIKEPHDIEEESNLPWDFIADFHNITGV